MESVEQPLRHYLPAIYHHPYPHPSKDIQLLSYAFHQVPSTTIMGEGAFTVIKLPSKYFQHLG